MSQNHTTENHILMVLMVKSWWFVMAFVIYLWFICDGVRNFCDGSIVFFSAGLPRCFYII